MSIRSENSFKDYVLDQLDGLRDLSCRAMFGGFGLYHRNEFFGIVFKQRLYFKTDAVSRKDYVVRGMKPFKPNPRQTLKSYYQVPDEVLDDRDMLQSWAQRAVILRNDKTSP